VSRCVCKSSAAQCEKGCFREWIFLHLENMLVGADSSHYRICCSTDALHLQEARIESSTIYKGLLESLQCPLSKVSP
jgi:hypothetical protein